MLLGPTGHLLIEATPSRPGDTADLPNTQKQAESHTKLGDRGIHSKGKNKTHLRKRTKQNSYKLST